MKVYLDYDQVGLDRQYEHRHFVSDADEILAFQAAESARVRAAAKGRFDVAYGDGEDELLVIYLAEGDGPAPIVVFFQGGRWAMGSKNSNCEAAEMYTAMGVHFVSVNFSLLPGVTMDVLIGQCRDAAGWIWRNASDFGGDNARMFVHGKSSGAHVAGMMAVTDWSQFDGLPADLFKGGLLVSGMYDLEPVRLTYRNEWLKMDERAALANSPIRHIPNNGCPLIVGVGALETDKFRRQSKEFSEAWSAAGLECQFAEMPDRHHFSVNEDMNVAGSELTKPFLALMGR